MKKLILCALLVPGIAVGAERGYIYLRVEYPHAKAVLEDAIEKLEGEIAAATDPKQRAELEAELATKRSWLEVVAAAG